MKKNSIKPYLNFLDKDTLLHLRIPFSFYLLPIFCFALSQACPVHLGNTLLVFMALHLFIYPASNVYNSYMDKDEGSIGGLEHPPVATIKLFYASILFDLLGLLTGAFLHWKFVLILLLYISVSKAYSWHKIRLKKYAIVSWLVVVIFQGGYTFMLVHMAISNNFTTNWFNKQHILACLIASLQIGGFYPLTQIYQHQEDTRRGDRTISSVLGYQGTFIFSGLFFTASCIAFFFYFKTYATLYYFGIYLLVLLPLLAYFINWFYKVTHDPTQANFKNAMRMNQVAALCMLTFFSILIFLRILLFLRCAHPLD
jgi:1,4-dihydroxy-2-naphthoate octaprenyltransferase